MHKKEKNSHSFDFSECFLHLILLSIKRGHSTRVTSSIGIAVVRIIVTLRKNKGEKTVSNRIRVCGSFDNYCLAYQIVEAFLASENANIREYVAKQKILLSQDSIYWVDTAVNNTVLSLVKVTFFFKFIFGFYWVFFTVYAAVEIYAMS